MVFSSTLFIFFFLPTLLLGYYLTPAKLKNLYLTLASLFFYFWGAPSFLLLFIFSSLVDYLISILMLKFEFDKGRMKKLLIISIVWNVGLLGYFKYFNFFILQFGTLMADLGLTAPRFAKVILPIGISFFTFHKISYVVDVYRKVSKPVTNFIDYLLYISFLPQLIAGPIVRYHEIESYIKARKISVDDIYAGLVRFIIGLSKKILIADPMAQVADHAFSLKSDVLTFEYSWLGIICYSVQIYFDFSGYSDMAIGLARIFGFKFPENFNKPYLAQSFTDFWKRWHISLSRWMKDYLYIPMGGSRTSTLKTYRNLCTVFLLSGLWHGANWTFIFWGIYHGTFLVMDRVFLENFLNKVPKFFRVSFTYIFVLFGWVLFRSDSIGHSYTYYSALLDISNQGIQKFIPRASVISDHGIFTLVIGLIVIFVFEARFFSQFKLSQSIHSNYPRASFVLYNLMLFVFFLLSVMMIESANYSPFIYFQF